MRKIMGFISILVLFLIFSWLIFAENKNDEFKRTHYIIDIKLNMPGLDPPAVQMSIFNEDPINNFGQHVRIYKGSPNLKYDTDYTPSSWMELSWNGSFRMITGDCVYLLTMESVRYSSSDTGKKVWIITKVAHMAGKPVCWRIPLNVKIGEEYQVVLSKNNQFDLEGTFNEIMSN